MIEGNLVNKKHLSADRSFILFDPEPFLDDTDQYMKYSPQELVEIFTKYDSDIEKYEASKKSLEKDQKELSDNEVVANQSNSNDNEMSNMEKESRDQRIPENNCDEKHSTNEMFSDNNLLNVSKSVDDSNVNENTCQKPRFTDIYKLFEIPDFSLLKTAQHNNTNDHSTDEQLTTDEEESDVSAVMCEKDSEEEYRDEGELVSGDDEEWSECSKEIESSEVEEVVWSDEVDDWEPENKNKNYEENIKSKSFDRSIKMENSNDDKYDDDDDDDRSIKCNDKPIKISISNNDVQKNVVSPRVVNEVEDGDQQLVDYDVLSNWYQMWKQQMSFIQTCVRMSK